MNPIQTPIKFFIIISMIVSVNYALAQRNFTINEGSKYYTAKITVERCEDGVCSGKGTVTLYDKVSGNLFQTFNSDDLFFFLGTDSEPSVNVIELYYEESPVIYNDFNFDGSEDVAIRSGNNGAYGGPSYNVYLFDKTKNKFVNSSQLTELASVNLGMFETDNTRKRISTFTKSGCCFHLTIEYAISSDNEPVKVYELEEDATGGDGSKVKVTERNLVNGKWEESIKIYKTKDYYKE